LLDLGVDRSKGYPESYPVERAQSSRSIISDAAYDPRTTHCAGEPSSPSFPRYAHRAFLGRAGRGACEGLRRGAAWLASCR
jgi:hypothetical protein